MERIKLKRVKDMLNRPTIPQMLLPPNSIVRELKFKKLIINLTKKSLRVPLPKLSR